MERLEKYPDEESLFFGDLECHLITLRSSRDYLVYLESILFLIEHNEIDNLDRLLFKGLHFCSLFYDMKERQNLPMLRTIMGLDEITGLDDQWSTWVGKYPCHDYTDPRPFSSAENKRLYEMKQHELMCTYNVEGRCSAWDVAREQENNV